MSHLVHRADLIDRWLAPVAAGIGVASVRGGVGGPRVLAGRVLAGRVMVGAMVMVAIVALAGCSSSPDDRDGSERAAPESISFFADYPRYLWDKRRVAVATTNDRSEPITVSRIALRSDHFVHLEPEVKTTVITPGSRVDIQVDFGAVQSCDRSETLEAEVEIDIATSPDGPTMAYTVPLDPTPLDEILDRECSQQRIARAAEVAFGAHRNIDGNGHLFTTIEVSRRQGDDPIVVTSIRGSEIFALKPSALDGPLVDMAPTVATASIPVEIFVTRCDPHVMAASSRTFDLKVFVVVGDAEPVQVIPELDQRFLEDLATILTRCVEEGGP